MTQRHPKPVDEEFELVVRPIRRLLSELERLRTARAALRDDNAALRAELAAVQAPAQPEPSSPESEALWEAYSRGVQNGYDHQQEGTQPNWFAVRGDFDAWLESSDGL